MKVPFVNFEIWWQRIIFFFLLALIISVGMFIINEKPFSNEGSEGLSQQEPHEHELEEGEHEH